MNNTAPKHLVIACPHTTGWAVMSVWAAEEAELEKLAKEMLAELILDEFLCLAKRYPSLCLAAYRGNDSRRGYLLSELFKRAQEKELEGEEYVVYVGTDGAELPVPRQNTMKTLHEPMDVMIKRLLKEIRAILKNYPG